MVFLFIFFSLEFMVNIQYPSVADKCFEYFSVPLLRDFVGADEDKILLCCMRAVLFYFLSSKHFCPTCKHLFVS